MGKVVCPHCGKEVDVSTDSPFCSACGKRVLVSAQPETGTWAQIKQNRGILIVIGLVLVAGILAYPYLTRSRIEWYLYTYTTEYTLDQRYAWTYWSYDFSTWSTDLSKTEGDVWEWKVEVIQEPNKITGVIIMTQWWYEQFENKRKSSHYEALIEALDQCEYEFKCMEDFRTITFYWHPMDNEKYYLILLNERDPHGDLKFRLTRNIYTQGQRWSGGTKIASSQVPTNLSTRFS